MVWDNLEWVDRVSEILESILGSMDGVSEILKTSL